MEKSYEQEYKPAFFQQFGRFPITMVEENGIKSIREPKQLQDTKEMMLYEKPICNKYCAPLDAPEVDCRYEKKDMSSGGDVCEFEFNVKTVNMTE